MSIDYFEEQIKKKETHIRGPFIGYINPHGQVIDYSILLGVPGHDNWRNPVTPYFLNFVSYVVLGDSLEFFKTNANKGGIYKEIYEDNKYDGFDDFVLRGPTTFCMNLLNYDSFINDLNDTIKNVKKFRHCNEWDCLKYDLMNFFEKCYSKKDFFYSFGRVIKIHNRETVFEIYKNFLKNWDDREKESFYYNYRVVTLMSYFKDIVVQYLGYDSIERALPNYDLNIINNLYRESGGYTFSPKSIILTSCANPNERFYNWLLMGWDIQRIPRMIWNEQEKRFVEENPIISYHQTEKEIFLGQEIELIKRNVPEQYRKEFLRK